MWLTSAGIKTSKRSRQCAKALSPMEQSPLGRSTLVRNLQLAKASAPEAEIIVDSKLTASFDPKLHQATLDVLGGIQVKVL